MIISVTVNALPDVGNPTEAEREPETLGRVIFNRIGTLERTRLQTKCLQMLSALPVWDQLVFRGATALHGVHLHGRCSHDLDFLAPADVKSRFVEILAEQGIALQESEGRRTPFFPMQGTIFKEIAVGIDVCQREISDLTWVSANFCGAGGVTIPVRAMPLPLQMTEKLRATSQRKRSTDFYDFWLFTQKRPDILPDVQRWLRIGEVDGEQLPFDVPSFWDHLQQLKPCWHNDLIAFMPQVPSFETVERDLSRTLETLGAVPTHT